MEPKELSYERMMKALVNLGLKHSDAEVYVFLATKGNHKARDLADALGFYKQQLYRSLKRLQNKGIVHATNEHPTLYSAVPFTNALDLFVKAKIKEAQNIEQNRNEILSYWQSMTT